MAPLILTKGLKKAITEETSKILVSRVNHILRIPTLITNIYLSLKHNIFIDNFLVINN